MSCAFSPIAPLLSPSSLIASPVERVFDTMPSCQPCRALTGTWGQLVRRDLIAPGSGAQERPGPALPAKQARFAAWLAAGEAGSGLGSACGGGLGPGVDGRVRGFDGFTEGRPAPPVRRPTPTARARAPGARPRRRR